MACDLGLAVGSTLANGGATNLYVVNCLVTNSVDAIYLKSDRDRGNLMQNFTYANLVMTNISQMPFMIYSYYTNLLYGYTDTVTPASAALDPGQPVTATTPIWRDITFSNIIATTTDRAGTIWGLPEMLVSNVTFTGVSISAAKSFYVLNARGVRFVDSPITTLAGLYNFELYNAELTLSNSAPGSTPVSLDGFSTNGIGNTLLLYNTRAIVKNTNLLAASPAITLGGSTLIVSNSLNLGGASSLNFVLGTNTTCLVVAGNLVLNGTINVSAGSGFTPTNYTLFRYSGSLGGIPVLGATPTVHSYNYALDTNTPGQVNLVVAAPPPPSFGNIQVAPGGGGAFVMSGSGGVTNGLFNVLASTNLTLPMAQWPVVDTNPFDANGHFLFTNVPGSNAAQMFYLLEVR